MITIVLADDHSIVRQGLRTLLEAEPGFRVVGEAADGIEANQLVERLRPDVLVLDLRMPGLSGLEVAWQVRQRSPQTKVIILSMYANKAYLLEALHSGTAGYVLKKSTIEELVQAVREVTAGRRYLSPAFSDEEALDLDQQSTKAAVQDPFELLTPREREILQLVTAGYTSAEIAERLVVSPRTVETHRANLMRKLNLRNQAELIRYGLRRGLLPSPDEPD